MASAGTIANPARTEALRVAPPATARSRAASAGGTTTTTPALACAGDGDGDVEDPPIPETLELLGRPEPGAAAGADDDGPDRTGVDVGSLVAARSAGVCDVGHTGRVVPCCRR